MRILRIIADVDPRSGGPIEGLKLSSTRLAEKGHTTEVVTLDDPNSPHVRDFPFKVHGCGPTSKRYGYTPKMAKWILANSQRFDVAVIHGLWNHASIGGWRGLAGANLPYVVYTHGMMDPWFKQSYPLKHMAKQVFWWIAQGRVLRDAQSVLFTSDEERRLASGSFTGYAYQERVVAYSASHPPMPDPSQLDSFYAKAGSLSRDRKFFLFLSRIHEKKGCDLLLSAFARVASQYPEIDLVFAGPDQVGLAKQLKAQAENIGIGQRVHWTGMLAGAEKWGAFRAADAFVLPSHQENFGIVVAESLACGTPVLITDKVNIWREIKAAQAGFIQPDTAEGIFNLLLGWLTLAEDQKDAMREAARKAFEQNFTSEAAASDLLRVLEDAMENATK